MSSIAAPVRVTLVNDYELIVDGLRRMLQPFSDRIDVIEPDAGGLPAAPCDVALFDTFAGRRHSLERMRDMTNECDVGRLVVYTWDAPASFLGDVERRGIDAVILKSTTGVRLVEALEMVHRGEAVGIDPSSSRIDSTSTLTEREREVLALMAQGATNREIADQLYLSFDTVKTHVRKVFAKLDVKNRTQAALAARHHGLAPPSDRQPV